MIKNNFNWNNLNSVKRSYLIYGSILVGFIIWMVFIDSHSLIIHSELNKEIKKLESEKKALEAIINNDKNTINKLNNIDSLESFARENYGHKKENETIYIIETQD
jgi:cell division protein FtsB